MQRGLYRVVAILALLCCVERASSDHSPSRYPPHRRLAAPEAAAELPLRGAMIVTLAGNHKLAPYFEWSCRTFGASREYYDMLVFHESNSMIPNVRCPENVKMVDLGEKGLSDLLVEKVLEGTTLSGSVKNRMKGMVDDIINHIPRYLVEVKPMFGTLFHAYLKAYTHWSYTDPDIIWGNLVDAVDVNDLELYDVVSVAKNSDAGRLFLRGQLSFHKNIALVNDLWKQLPYFSYEKYAERIASAHHMLEQKKDSELIFSRNFHSAEGWYSQIVFKAGVTVKIIGRGFDDFYRHPVVYKDGQLTRCSADANLTSCLDAIEQQQLQQQEQQLGSGSSNSTTISTDSGSSSSSSSKIIDGFKSLPPVKLIEASANYDANKCKMFWLPIETRFCITSEEYVKNNRNPNGGSTGGAVISSMQNAKLKLRRVGEAVLEGGQWFVNDEQKARRQVPSHAAFFHFRHWDDFIATSISTSWGGVDGASDDPDTMKCMVLYLRKDGAMSFEACDVVRSNEAVVASTGMNIQLRGAPDSSARVISNPNPLNAAGEDVGTVLKRQRKQSEVGFGRMDGSSRAGGWSGGGGGSSVTAHRDRAAAAAERSGHSSRAGNGNLRGNGRQADGGIDFDATTSTADGADGGDSSSSSSSSSATTSAARRSAIDEINAREAQAAAALDAGEEEGTEIGPEAWRRNSQIDSGSKRRNKSKHQDADASAVADLSPEELQKRKRRKIAMLRKRKQQAASRSKGHRPPGSSSGGRSGNGGERD